MTERSRVNSGIEPPIIRSGKLDRDFVRITDPKDMYPKGPFETEMLKSLLRARTIWAALVVFGGTYLAKEMHRRILRKGSLI